ncbi:MAG TPA: hypothetical protein ENK24_08200 [Anaerolineae bacterium]|nr:hypothetical protein [Anaerolineae bacterium]
MNKKGDFPISVLADSQGFPIAFAAAPDQDPAIQSAVVALVQKATAQAGSQLGMSQTDEISLYDTEGRRLICRPFNVNDHSLILAVLVPDKRQSYRRLTNTAVSAVKRQWRL